jgi:hypothetical protein
MALMVLSGCADPDTERDRSGAADATPSRDRCARGALRDGEGALHARCSMTGDGAVEGVRAGGCGDGHQPGLAGLDLDVDVKFVDEKVWSAVPVLGTLMVVSVSAAMVSRVGWKATSTMVMVSPAAADSAGDTEAGASVAGATTSVPLRPSASCPGSEQKVM